jgi:hypothetical protein
MTAQLDLGDRRPNTARFSPDEVYRYTLTRELGGDRTCVSAGLNPSKATAEINDNTVRKDMEFARRWQCGRLLKINAYGYRATDPNDMKRARKSGVDIVGPDNDYWIRDAIELVRTGGGIFVASWGNHIEPLRQREIWQFLVMAGIKPLCLGTNQNGTPVHELYIPYERPLVEWTCP